MGAFGFSMSHPPGVDPYYTSRVHLFSPHSHVVLARLCVFHSYFGISKQTEILQEVQEAEEHYFCSSVYLRKMKQNKIHLSSAEFLLSRISKTSCCSVCPTPLVCSSSNVLGWAYTTSCRSLLCTKGRTWRLGSCKFSSLKDPTIEL